MNNEAQCKCWPEVSLLNDESVTRYGSPIEIWMYNFTQDDGATLKICATDNGNQDAIRIHYCPLCGRFLG